MDANELANAGAHGKCSPKEGTGPAWGITIEEARADYARLSMVVRTDMLNSHRIVHGGMVFALADTAFAYVCNGRNQKTVAAQASIVFLGSSEEGETLIAEADRDRNAPAARASPAFRSALPRTDAPIAEFTGYSRTLTGETVEL